VVAGWPAARLRLLRDEALGRLRAVGADRRAAAGLGACRRQRRAGLVTNGKKLALTLGGSGGNPDIYVLDLATQELARVTDDPAIDTEPEWAPDGRSLYFTSDRAGSPQIYQIGVAPGSRPKRITFGANYDARPRISPDGSQLAMVTLDNGNYRIAVQDLASGAVRVLSHGHLDESPSFAPNGATLMYSEREGSRGSLATVSTDGLTGLRLRSSQGEVQEPAWGPYSP
jgi:TolB protein